MLELRIIAGPSSEELGRVRAVVEGSDARPELTFETDTHYFKVAVRCCRPEQSEPGMWIVDGEVWLGLRKNSRYGVNRGYGIRYSPETKTGTAAEIEGLSDAA